MVSQNDTIKTQPENKCILKNLSQKMPNQFQNLFFFLVGECPKAFSFMNTGDTVQVPSTSEPKYQLHNPNRVNHRLRTKSR